MHSVVLRILHVSPHRFVIMTIYWMFHEICAIKLDEIDLMMGIWHIVCCVWRCHRPPKNSCSVGNSLLVSGSVVDARWYVSIRLCSVMFENILGFFAIDCQLRWIKNGLYRFVIAHQTPLSNICNQKYFRMINFWSLHSIKWPFWFINFGQPEPNAI